MPMSVLSRLLDSLAGSSGLQSVAAHNQQLLLHILKRSVTQQSVSHVSGWLRDLPPTPSILHILDNLQSETAMNVSLEAAYAVHLTMVATMTERILGTPQRALAFAQVSSLVLRPISEV